MDKLRAGNPTFQRLIPSLERHCRVWKMRDVPIIFCCVEISGQLDFYR